MKAFTDILQSKKLAEFLPLESADMWYWEFPTAPTYNDYGYPMFHKGEDIRNVPCWSLAALLSVLPTIDDDEFEPQLHRSLDKYCCTYEGKEDSRGLWRVADNPIDACYEMIIKLKEQKLL